MLSCRTSIGRNATAGWRKQRKCMLRYTVNPKPIRRQDPLRMQMQRRRCGFNVAVTAMLMVFTNLIAEAQTPGTPITIGQAVENALRIYPSVSVSQEQVTAAAAGIDLARTAYLPRVDSIAQVNRATETTFSASCFRRVYFHRSQGLLWAQTISERSGAARSAGW